MRYLLVKMVVVSSLLIFVSCGQKEEPKEGTTQQEMNTMPSSSLHVVKIEEKLDASNYTYLKVSENNISYWIAVPTMDVKPGETVSFSKSMEMKNFKSETLNRTFESVLFVDDAHKGAGEQADLKSPHSSVVTQKNPSIKIEKLKDGYSIANIYNQKSLLVNKVVKVKGVVVKVNENVMGINWIHIQDGTSGDGNNYDLLVTSDANAKVGQTIVAEGKVISDKDFGAGYYYPVLLEKSKITIQ
jgi:hypothetical protein